MNDIPENEHGKYLVQNLDMSFMTVDTRGNIIPKTPEAGYMAAHTYMMSTRPQPGDPRLALYLTRLKIFDDSQLVAQQVMNKCDAVNDNMMAYRDAYNDLEGTFDGCEVKLVSRNSNDEADVLA